MGLISLRRGFHVFAFLILLSACGTTAPAQDPIPFDPAFLNRQIELTAPQYFNSFKSADSVGLKIMYHADQEIRFQNYYGIRIFEYTTSGWTEIGEAPTQHYPPGDESFSPKSGPNGAVIGVFPNLTDFERSYRIRIYVIGEMSNNTATGSTLVGAYTDIDLHP